ncbi:hypothetical protein ACGF3J_38420 [Streptomyces sp. NPDC048171]|uniref:hypothetical protein n=1 Tax=Streptomyces sp. NPDC048171 TaxID=3365504 RepID=UPI003713B509
MGDANTWAAWAAAAASLATLTVTTVVGGRREQHRWAREALTDAFVRFLEASWEHSDVMRLESAAVGDQHQQAVALYREMRTQLTRLRLLASANVLTAGEDLLRRQRAVHECVQGPERQAALAEAAAGRRLVVEVAKKEMGL